MRDTWLLIKNYFKCFLGRVSSKKGNASKTSIGLLIVILFSSLFVYMFVNLAIMTTKSALDVGEPSIALYINATMAVLFSLFMMITKSTLPNKNSDEDNLLSLPIKKSSIICAKIFYDYLFDFAVVLVTILPAYIVYFILVPGVTIFLVIRAIVICLLLPMFLCAMGYFLGLFFSIIASKFKHYSIFQSIFTIIFMVIFLVCYYGLTIISTENPEHNAGIIMGIAPIEWIVSFIAIGKVSAIILISLITIVPFILSIFLKTKLLGLSFSKYKIKNANLIFEQSTITKSLYKRELSRYFNSSTYIVNTMFGGIILIIISIVILIIGKKYLVDILKTSGFGNLDAHFVPIVLILSCFSVATICTTSCSISIEGKSLWILKVHPISEKAIFKSKILANLTISLPFIIISALLFAISLGFQYLLFLILIPASLSLSVSMIGLIVNLYYPKLEWVSEINVIKQSLSVGLAIIINIIIGIIPFIIYFMMYEMVNIYLLLSLVFLFNIIINVITYVVLMQKGKLLFKNIY